MQESCEKCNFATREHIETSGPMVTPRTVYDIEENCTERGLARALHADPRLEWPVQLGQLFVRYVVATMCSDRPEGFDR